MKSIVVLLRADCGLTASTGLLAGRNASRDGGYSSRGFPGASLRFVALVRADLVKEAVAERLLHTNPALLGWPQSSSDTDLADALAALVDVPETQRRSFADFLHPTRLRVIDSGSHRAVGIGSNQANLKRASFLAMAFTAARGAPGRAARRTFFMTPRSRTGQRLCVSGTVRHLGPPLRSSRVQTTSTETSWKTPSAEPFRPQGGGGSGDGGRS